MSQDLSKLLQEWPHEPGQIQVRRIEGEDGSAKLQLRIDLGLIQMELTGRPDGQRPHDCESLLEFYKQEATTKGSAFSLSEEQCAELQVEGIQYYHRYVTLFQLEDYDGVIRDTDRNLDLFNFVEAHCQDPETRHSFLQFRPYVLMMNGRAQGMLALEKGDTPGAIAHAEKAREAIRAFLGQSEDEEEADSHEIAFLDQWIEDLKNRKPESELERMNLELAEAIEVEAYEKAAELRDAIKALTEKSPSPS